MNYKNLTTFFTGIFILSLAFFLSSCTKKPLDGMVIFTEIPQKDFTEFEGWKISDLTGSHLFSMYYGEKKSTPIDLTADFYSAALPQISYDGENMLFSAQKEVQSPWQIWEMNLKTRKVRQITNLPENCTNPAYLPGNRLIFSRLISEEKYSGYELFTGNLDGSNILQITFGPQNFTVSSVLKDGRPLSITRQILPEFKNNLMMVLRPDGTKLELFYKSEGKLLSNPRETEEGKILFVETGDSPIKSEIVSIDYNLPMYSRKVLTTEISGEFGFATPFQQNSIITSYRKSANDVFSLCELNAENQTLTEIWKNNDKSIVDAVIVRKYDRPKNLPSEIQMTEKTGLIMCQDINFLGMESLEDKPEKVKAERIEILGIDSVLGIVDVENDGSFYLKIIADTPFRIQTTTKEGVAVNGPGSWYYVRPNERLGCVGCHTGTEISPFNRQPVSVRKNPVEIPTNLKLDVSNKSKDYEHD